jgi:hypothetical protein
MIAPAAVRTLSPLDQGLAIGAAVASVAGMAALIYLKFFLTDTTGS